MWKDRFRARVIDQRAGEWFSDLLGAPVRLVMPADDTRRTLDPRYADPERETMFADGFPLLITNRASLRALNDELHRASPPHAEIDMLRFRPNLVVDSGEAWDEDNWLAVEINGLRFECVKACVRCSLIGVDPQSGTREGEPLLAIARLRSDTSFGVNLVHAQPGMIRVGDRVQVIRRE